MNINADFQKDFDRLEKLIRAICPAVTDIEMKLIKQEVKSTCGNMIHNIGNSVNGLTHSIEL